MEAGQRSAGAEVESADVDWIRPATNFTDTYSKQTLIIVLEAKTYV